MGCIMLEVIREKGTVMNVVIFIAIVVTIVLL